MLTSFKIDDGVEIQGSRCKVLEISLQATLIEDENGDKIFIPSLLILNGKIKVITPKQIANWYKHSLSLAENLKISSIFPD